MLPLKTDPDTLGFLLNETSRLLRQNFERRIAGIGLAITPGEARALIYVAANEGARQSVIAERMGVEPMTVCGYIERLERHGLVARKPDPVDRRAKQVHTTDAADGTIAAIRAEAKAMVDQVQSGLDGESRILLLAALKHVRANLLELVGERPTAKRAQSGMEIDA